MSRTDTTVHFVPRLHHRFPTSLPIHYLHTSYIGKGTITNVSLRGWRVLGQDRVEVGNVLTFNLPFGDQTNPSGSVQTIVRWVRGEAFGVEVRSRQPEIEARLRTWVRAMAKSIILSHPLSTL